MDNNIDNHGGVPIKRAVWQEQKTAAGLEKNEESVVEEFIQKEVEEVQASALDIMAVRNQAAIRLKPNLGGITVKPTVGGSIIHSARPGDFELYQKPLEPILDGGPVSPARPDAYTTYTLQQLQNVLDDATIEIYFEKSGSRYIIRNEYKHKFSKLEDVVNYKNTVHALQNQLILTNLLNGFVNHSGNSASTLLYNNITNNILTINNYEQVLAATTLLSGEELAELKENAVKRFVSDFSQGNLAYEQAKLILDAIGVNDLSMKLEGGIYTISFKFDNRNFTVSCEQSAAQKGNDTLMQTNIPEAYVNTFRSQGASESLINKYFYKTTDIDGSTSYALREGKRILELEVELGLKTTMSYSDINALNIGLSDDIFSQIIDVYFEQVNVNGNNLYVLKIGSIELVQNVIIETYVSSRIGSSPDFNPSVPDTYEGMVLCDNDVWEDRKANYYYMCYMTGTIFTGTEFEDGNFDVELAIACGVYPCGENVFAEFLKNSEAREYLSTNFGINVPDPSNTSAFNNFVNNNRELWNKIADLAAIDSKGNYTGEYNKYSVLKFFGLAMTDTKIKEYVEKYTYKSETTQSSTVVPLSSYDDMSVTQNYLHENYSDLFESGILNSELYDQIGKLAYSFVLTSSSKYGIDEELLLQYTMDALVCLAKEADIAGKDVNFYIKDNFSLFIDNYIQSRLSETSGTTAASPRRVQGQPNSNPAYKNFIAELEQKYGAGNVHVDPYTPNLGNYTYVAITTPDGVYQVRLFDNNTVQATLYKYYNGEPYAKDYKFYDNAGELCTNITDYYAYDFVPSNLSPDSVIQFLQSDIMNLDPEFSIKLLYEMMSKNEYFLGGIPNNVVNNTFSSIFDKLSSDYNYIKMWFNTSAGSSFDIYNSLIQSLNLHLENKNNIKPYVLDNVLFGNASYQGRVGSCWLLSGLAAFCQDTEFLNLMNQCVTFNGNGYSVVIQGHNYNFSLDEVLSANEFSSGSLAVRAFEMAASAFMGQYGVFGDYNINGGNLIKLKHLLTGNADGYKSYGYGNDELRNNIALLKQQIQSGQYKATAGLNQVNNQVYGTNILTGGSVEITTAHEYQILNIDDNYVYLVDPGANDGQNILKISMQDFLNNFYMDTVDMNILKQGFVNANPWLNYTPDTSWWNNSLFGDTSSNTVNTPLPGNYMVTQNSNGFLTISGTISNPLGGSKGNAFSGGGSGNFNSLPNNTAIDYALEQLLNGLRAQGITANDINWSQDSNGNIFYWVMVQDPNNNPNANMPTVEITNLGEYVNDTIQNNFPNTLRNGNSELAHLSYWAAPGGEYDGLAYQYTFNEFLNDIQNNKFVDQYGNFNLKAMNAAIESMGANAFNMPAIEGQSTLEQIYEVYVKWSDGQILKITITRGSDTLNVKVDGDTNSPDFLPKNVADAIKNAHPELWYNPDALNAKMNEFLNYLTYRTGLENLASSLQLASYFAYTNGTFDPSSFEEFLNVNFTKEDGTIDYEALRAFASAVRDYENVKYNNMFNEIESLKAWVNDIGNRDRGPTSIYGSGNYGTWINAFDTLTNAGSSPEAVMNAIYTMDRLEAEAKMLGLSLLDYLTMSPFKIANLRGKLTTPMTAVYTLVTDEIHTDGDGELGSTTSQNSIITAPNWFKYLYKTNGITQDSSGWFADVNMSDEEMERLDAEIEHFQIWRDKNPAFADLPVGSLYNVYQYDMAMFMMWSIFELPMLNNVPENMSWEELYNLYVEKTGGLHV